MILALALLAADPVALPAPSTPVAPVTSETRAFATSEPLDTQALNQATAREDISQVSQSNQANAVTGNSVGNQVRTGNVSFSDSAFQNQSGLTIINANSGNNVAINSSLNVNLNMTPGG